jgi:hypothetical protein
VFAVTRAFGFRLLERAGFAPLVHGWLPRTRSRWIVGGWGVRASHQQGGTGKSGQFYVHSYLSLLVLIAGAGVDAPSRVQAFARRFRDSH